MPLQNTMKQMQTSDGSNVLQHSEDRHVFLVFLRHFSCMFCRESMLDLSKKENDFKQKNVQPIFVHMEDNEVAKIFFSKFNLQNPIHVSDPSCSFYVAFGLAKGKFNQLFGLKGLVRGMEVATKGIFPSLKEIGDGYQMPGIFIVKDGQVIQSYIHNHASDKPNYNELINCCKV